MKKIVVILIVGLYIGSVFLVNFFGLKFSTFEMELPVEKINCTLENYFSKEQIPPEPELDYDATSNRPIICYEVPFIVGTYTAEVDSLANNKNTFQIKYTVEPETAHEKSVRLSYTPKPKRYYVDEENLTVTFLKEGSITIDIIAADGNEAATLITISAWS